MTADNIDDSDLRKRAEAAYESWRAASFALEEVDKLSQIIQPAQGCSGGSYLTGFNYRSICTKCFSSQKH